MFACTFPLTSDLVDDQVHLAVGALAQLPDHLVVLVDLQPLQVLGCDQLQLVQDVHVGSRHQRRGAHAGDRFRGRTVGKKHWGTDAQAGQEQQQLTPGVTVRKQERTHIFKILTLIYIIIIKFDGITPVGGAIVTIYIYMTSVGHVFFAVYPGATL